MFGVLDAFILLQSSELIMARTLFGEDGVDDLVNEEALRRVKQQCPHLLRP